MAKILCIETATVNCSVAVFSNDTLLASAQSNTGGFSHSENLHVFIRDVISQAGLAFAELDLIAVSRGPGSYTGLRIGVSAAKGLAYALGIPVVAVDTLEIMARVAQRKVQADIYVPMIDARRMEIYTAAYDQKMDMTYDISAVVVDEHSFDHLPQDKTVCFCGDGMAKCRELIHHPDAIFSDDVYPEASAMGAQAMELYQAQKWEDVAYFEPYYLKDFVGGGGSTPKTKV